jgi:4-hydroxy-tetrahydrodipicolinate synthase
MVRDAEPPQIPPGVGRLVTAMATPFTEDRDLDLDRAHRLAAHLLTTGPETVLLAGTTGESPTLHGDETYRLLRAVREVVAGRGTVMVGVGTNDTRHSLEMTERASADGADALLVVMPYYNKPDRRGQIDHFGTIAAATDLPVVLYDVPGRTARDIDLGAIVELAGVDNIVGLKDASLDLGKAGDILHRTAGSPGGFALWCGADELNLPLLAVGAVGAVSVASHLVGPEISEMIDVFGKDPYRARELHLRCMPVHRGLFAAPSPAPLKGALRAMGLPGGPVRPPLADATDEVVETLVAAVRAVEAAR